MIYKMSRVPYLKEEAVDRETRRANYLCWEWFLSLFRQEQQHDTYDEKEQGTYSDIKDESDSNFQEEVSKIVIKNLNEGGHDHHLGLQLRSHSKRNHTGLKCYLHILEYIDSDGPGKDLRIKNRDEILMINDKFLPPVTHTDVKSQFYNLKVDGQSTFNMILRRKKKSGKWKWLEIFAILAPCKCSVKDKDTAVQNPKCTKLMQNRKEFVSDHIYKIGGTQLFLQIDKNGLQADTMTGDSGDKTKVIQKRAAICQHGDRLITEVSLSDKRLCRYLMFCPETNNIVLCDTPQFFQCSQLGNDTHFMSDNGHYLSYDHERNEVKPQKDKFAFEEFPVPDHLV